MTLMRVPVELDLESTYLYEIERKGENGNPNEWVRVGAYRMIAFAADARKPDYVVVVYVGVEGLDCGRWFFCPLDDWARKFKKIVKPAEPEPRQEPLPAREAGGAIPGEVHEIALSAAALRQRCEEVDTKRREV